MLTIFTIGYQGKRPGDLVQALQNHGIKTVIDVRDNPWSRNPRYCRCNLQTTLQEGGLGYLHARELGNPRELRASATSVRGCLESYARYMEPRWDTALLGAEKAMEAGPIALLCMEADPDECHRTIVAMEISRRHGADVFHIGSEQMKLNLGKRVEDRHHDELRQMASHATQGQVHIAA